MEPATRAPVSSQDGGSQSVLVAGANRRAGPQDHIRESHVAEDWNDPDVKRPRRRSTRARSQRRLRLKPGAGAAPMPKILSSPPGRGRAASRRDRPVARAPSPFRGIRSGALSAGRGRGRWQPRLAQLALTGGQRPFRMRKAVKFAGLLQRYPYPGFEPERRNHRNRCSHGQSAVCTHFVSLFNPAESGGIRA